MKRIRTRVVFFVLNLIRKDQGFTILVYCGLQGSVILSLTAQIKEKLQFVDGKSIKIWSFVRVYPKPLSV